MKVGTDAVLLGAITKIGCAQNILDIGTGSGVIALMMAQRSNASIHAIDIDEASVKEATENFTKSPWKERLSSENCSLQSLSQSTRSKFDLIVSNPPFFTKALKNPDASKALARHNDNLSFETLLSLSAQLLNPGGKLSLILPATEERNIVEIAKVQNLFPRDTIYILPREDKPPNRIVLELDKNNSSKDSHSETFSIRNKNGEYSSGYISLMSDFLLYF
ncbi:MAG: methyltransferase [Bacteroidales bacterium]|nr:methyltransferase [Bacteroidales bacterium]MCF8328289.1 methyltransferase [Bacteroidales bacterium]